MKNGDIAEVFGIHPTTVSKWRSDVQVPSEAYRAILADLLGVLPSTFTAVGPKNSDESEKLRAQVRHGVLIGRPEYLARLSLQRFVDPKPMILDAMASPEAPAIAPDDLATLISEVEDFRLRYQSVNGELRPVEPSVVREALYIPGQRSSGLSLPVRQYLSELHLRLTLGGATEEEIEEAMALLRAPQVFSFYKGGVVNDYSDEDILRSMKGIAEGVVIPELRERGRNIP